MHQQYQNTFFTPTDAHNYKITGMLKTIKIPIIAPTCFGSRRNHHQGATSCLVKTAIMILLCSSLMTWSMSRRHASLCASVRYKVEEFSFFLYREEDLMHTPVQTVSSADSYKNWRCGLFFECDTLMSVACVLCFASTKQQKRF